MLARPYQLLACVLATVTLPAQSPSAEEFAAAVQWFEALGYPKVGDKPFVRVATGQCIRMGNEAPQNIFVHGFLLADDGAQFTVLTLDLDTRTYTRTARGTAEHQRVGYAAESLRDFARQAVKPREAEQDAEWLPPSGPSPTGGVTSFVLAWACRQAGDQELAVALAARAHGGFAEARGRTLQELLSRELGHVAMWRLILEFEEPKLSFAQVLADCDRFLKQFPDSKHVERAKGARQVLARMVEEQAARPVLLADAGEEARIAELVFQLREQNGRQWCQPGSCDVFADPRGEQSPAARLVALGYKALPALLKAFDDESLTRCVGYHRDFYFSHQVLTVREVAAQVFARITGTWVQTRAEAERHFAAFQQRGERALLIEGAERGDPEMARRLLASHRDAVLPALTKALSGPVEGWQRRQLLGVLSAVPGEEAAVLLRAALAREGDVQPRVTAAVALFLRGERDLAVDTMVALWKQGLENDAAVAVSRFLAVCGATRAIEALAVKCDRLDCDVVRALGTGEASFDQLWLPDGSSRGGYMRLGEPEAGADAAVEHMLGRMLDGWRVFHGVFGGTVDPDLGDLAADAMHHRWPDRYAFDFDAPRPRRHRQLLVLKNVWLARQGLAPMPLPEAPRLSEVDPAQVEELFTSARLEREVAARRAVLDRIEVLGSGASAAVAAEARAAKEPQRQREWQELHTRIASRVREVRLAGGSAPFPAGVEATAKALMGKRLDPAALVDVLRTIGGGDMHQARLARVTATRPDDGTGVVVELLFSKDPRGGATGVGYSHHVCAGTRCLSNSTGGGVRSVVAERHHYRDFERGLVEALLLPADQVVDARFEMHFR